MPDTYQGKQMKKITIFMLLLFATAVVMKAQDTIVLRNGKEMVVKVEKITSSELDYRNWGDVDGPLRVQNISDVFMVKYKGGTHEVFGETQNQATNKTASNNTYSGQVGLRPLERKGRSLVYVGTSMPLFDRDLQVILSPEQYSDYEGASRLCGTGFTFSYIGYLGLILGAVWYPMGITLDDMETFATIGIYCLGVASVFIPVGEIIAGIGKGKLSRIAEAYNANNHLASAQLGLSPTLMRTTNGIGAGLSLSLHF